MTVRTRRQLKQEEDDQGYITVDEVSPSVDREVQQLDQARHLNREEVTTGHQSEHLAEQTAEQQMAPYQQAPEDHPDAPVADQVNPQANVPTIGIRIPAGGNQDTTVVRIRVNEGVTDEEFGRGLAQVIASTFPQSGVDRGNRFGFLSTGAIEQVGPIYGLYGESDRVFTLLSDIIGQPDRYQNEVFCLSILPAPKSRIPRKPKHNIGFGTTVAALISLLAFLVLASFGGIPVVDTYEMVMEYFWHQVFRGLAALSHTFFFLADSLVDMPLRGLYRYGPYIGWEGASLPRICSRTTHYGDVNFWADNYEECEGIYQSKETAVLVIGRPLLCALYLYIVYLAIHKIMMDLHARRPNPDMVQTFVALNTLVRQLKRSFAAS